MKLSKRLQALAQFVPYGSSVADIGSDHGYLPIYLVEEGIVPRAIAADINQLPIESAKKNIQEANLWNQIETRLGNGLQVLHAYEVECITIAGMGGSLMCDILNQSPEVVKSLKRMILQPNIGAWNVRAWCEDNHWQIIAEDLIFEDGHFYEVMVLEPGIAHYSEVEKRIGPKLLEDKHPLLQEYLNVQKKKDDILLQSLEKSKSEESKNKKLAIQEKWKAIEEAYLCRF